MGITTPYDILYRAAPDRIIWGAEPGRLVKRVLEFCTGGNVVDAGCGDGKNALFLERLGFTIRGYDASLLALEGLENRFRRAGWERRGEYELRDLTANPIEETADVLVSYGLYHCLPAAGRSRVHERLQGAVKPGGVVLFTCLTDRLPLPDGHHTRGLELPSLEEVQKLFFGWDILHEEEGDLEEEHAPLVGRHRHSAVWIIARKPFKS